jgi:hypothetical protein
MDLRQHFWSTLIALLALLMALTVVTACHLWNIWLARREIESITQEDDGSVCLGQEIR